MRLAIFFLTAAVLAAQITAEKPLLVSSTLFGGNRNDTATAVAVDPDGNTYVTGETISVNFNGKPLPESKPTATNNGFITKIGPDGKSLVWSYVFGGNGNTHPNATALDPAGNLWITGRTAARDFPLVNPVQTKQSGLNIAFLLKLSPEGKILFSTYLGGERNDEANALAIDSNGNVYIGGRTNSEQFPVKQAMRPKYIGGDGFLAKFSNSGELLWSTYFGGSANDEVFGIAVGKDDSLYVTGDTNSNDLSTKGAWVEKPAGYAGFVAKVDPNGEKVEWCTYAGTRAGYTYARGIAVDPANNAYVVGYTSSKDLPVSANALQSKYSGGRSDAFLVKISADGSSAPYVTYLGGSFAGQSDPDEYGAAVRVDSHGLVYIVGNTPANDLPQFRARQDNFGGREEMWLARVDVENGRLVSSTFWGGTQNDVATAIALSPGENVTVVGYTDSTDFPAENAVQTTPGGNQDVAVARFCDPWLAASAGSLTINYTLGGGAPDAQSFDVFDGCTVGHSLTEVTAGESWLSVTPNSASLPGAKVSVSLNTDGLTAGEYHTTIRLTVPQAINGPVEIPVVLQVSDPPSQ